MLNGSNNIENKHDCGYLYLEKGNVLPSRLILFDLTFSLVPGPLLLLASVALKASTLVSLR
jgi:hypothetical protein